MGIDDLKFILIIVSSVLALILSVSAILGSLVYLATKVRPFHSLSLHFRIAFIDKFLSFSCF
jgi:hypothetical protein